MVIESGTTQAKESVLQNEQGSGDWLHGNVNIQNTTELYIFKWLEDGEFHIMCIWEREKERGRGRKRKDS